LRGLKPSQFDSAAAHKINMRLPYIADDESTFAELDQRITSVLVFLRGLKPSQFDSAAAHKINMRRPIDTLEFNGLDFFNGWLMPNFYFHYSTSQLLLQFYRPTA
jgi:hypothetical protein